MINTLFARTRVERGISQKGDIFASVYDNMVRLAVRRVAFYPCIKRSLFEGEVISLTNH